jgi:hypothetical protein
MNRTTLAYRIATLAIAAALTCGWIATAMAAEPSGTEKTPGPAAAEKTPQSPVKIQFQVRFQPWKEVLDWFSRKAGLSLVMETFPQGSFNYSDDREYTPTEAIDLLNEVLMTKGFMLICSGRMLVVVNMEEGMPNHLISRVSPAQLDKCRELEVVSILFDLNQLKPEEAENEIRKLLGPQGSVVTLPKSRQVLVTGLAGRVRVVRDVLARIEGPTGAPAPQLNVYPITEADPQAVMLVMSTTLSGQPDVRMSLDPKTKNLVVLAPPAAQATVKAALKMIDVPREKPASEMKVITLVHAEAASFAKTLAGLLGKEVQVAADQRLNSVIISGPHEQLAVAVALAERLDEQMPKDRPKPSASYEVRVVWLAAGFDDSGVPPADDLKDVVAELSRLGIKDPRQIGQMVVRTSDGSFNIVSAPKSGGVTVSFQAAGQILEQQGGLLRMQISAKAEAMFEVNTVVVLPRKQYVVLATTPVNTATSVLVVQVTGGTETAPARAKPR